MHVAFHFVEDESLGWPRPLTAVLHQLQRHKHTEISTKIFAGTVLFDHPISEYIENERGGVERVDPELLRRLIDVWSRGSERSLWTLKDHVRRVATNESEIFAVAVESVPESVARHMDKGLESADGYLGAGQLLETNPIDTGIYVLPPVARFHGGKVAVFWSGIDGEDKNEMLRTDLKAAGLGDIEFESLQGRYTIFDALSLPEARRQLAEAKSIAAELLGQVGEDVVTQFTDFAPDFGERLWAILTTFTDAKTSEQCSMVALSCRRLIEYAADQLFPAKAGDTSLTGPKYRNRLLAYADQTRAGDTDIELVCASTENLAQLLERLDKACHKGVHASITRRSARRCVIRTLLLVDDLLALRVGPLPMKLKLEEGFLSQLKEHLRGADADESDS